MRRWVNRDYAFRAFVPRSVVAQALADQVMNMTATNFKNTVHDDARHDAYLDVWKAMFRFQNGYYDNTGKKWLFDSSSVDDALDDDFDDEDGDYNDQE